MSDGYIVKIECASNKATPEASEETPLTFVYVPPSDSRTAAGRVLHHPWPPFSLAPLRETESASSIFGVLLCRSLSLVRFCRGVAADFVCAHVGVCVPARSGCSCRRGYVCTCRFAGMFFMREGDGKKSCVVNFKARCPGLLLGRRGIPLNFQIAIAKGCFSGFSYTSGSGRISCCFLSSRNIWINC